jgi:hypothetical protein
MSNPAPIVLVWECSFNGRNESDYVSNTTKDGRISAGSIIAAHDTLKQPLLLTL